MHPIIPSLILPALLLLLLPSLTLAQSSPNVVCLAGLLHSSVDNIVMRGATGEGRTAFILAISEVNRRKLLPLGWVLLLIFPFFHFFFFFFFFLRMIINNNEK